VRQSLVGLYKPRPADTTSRSDFKRYARPSASPSCFSTDRASNTWSCPSSRTARGSLFAFKSDGRGATRRGRERPPETFCCDFPIAWRFLAAALKNVPIKPAIHPFACRRQHEVENGCEHWRVVRLTRLKTPVHAYPSYFFRRLSCLLTVRPARTPLTWLSDRRVCSQSTVPSRRRNIVALPDSFGLRNFVRPKTLETI